MNGPGWPSWEGRGEAPAAVTESKEMELSTVAKSLPLAEQVPLLGSCMDGQGPCWGKCQW